MKAKILTGAILLCSFAICVAATINLSGEWKGVLKPDTGGEFALTYIFKADGDKFTGMVQTTLGDLPIENGTIKGDSITFSVNYNGTDIPNKGKCYPDSI